VGDHLGGDVAGAARPVVDDESLAEDLFELAPDDAGEHVARAARREGDDQRHRPGRIIGGTSRRDEGRGNECGDEGEGGCKESDHDDDPVWMIRLDDPVRTIRFECASWRNRRDQRPAA
jgi:hypothetical protein